MILNAFQPYIHLTYFHVGYLNSLELAVSQLSATYKPKQTVNGFTNVVWPTVKETRKDLDTGRIGQQVLGQLC